ncbi:Fructose-1-phosphate phosphatase YqaB [Pseudoruegeria aquimaris]|uniref:Fructose-1-phosphate phosphatase YqaB n=1 Tax=Pseudoruegeria aquimaris TaxID=393663 RepID=A0A1Y5R749_9RHOB|nr:HAD family phosphatase [Pseudoruegeria aquimaris]SLN10710.1 Fructose-1-phosphate phosphatase YqaB [Pseudoruegeria aquimaris]
MPVRALLFDLDGTMLHSDPIHVEVFAEMLAPHGIAVDEAFYNAHIHGRLNADIFAEFMPGAEDPQALSEAKEAAFRARLPRPYPAMPGLEAFLARAEAEGIPCAVVTNAPRVNAEAMLDAIGLRHHVRALVIGEECTHGKPHPEPYLRGAEALGASPRECLAFEDSPSGLRAARASGAHVIGIRSTLDDAALRAAGAHVTIKDFTDPALGPILHRETGAIS